MEEFTLGVISSILISFKALFRVLPAFQIRSALPPKATPV